GTRVNQIVLLPLSARQQGWPSRTCWPFCHRRSLLISPWPTACYMASRSNIAPSPGAIMPPSRERRRPWSDVGQPWVLSTHFILLLRVFVHVAAIRPCRRSRRKADNQI